MGFDPIQLHPDSAIKARRVRDQGMRERVEQLRGTLLVESAFGEGTTLMVANPGPDKRTPGARKPQVVSAVTGRTL